MIDEFRATDTTAVSGPASSRGDRLAVIASFLGWTLDAFDFFVVVFLVDTLARVFKVSKTEIIWTFTATLAMRPVGALLFGLLADRYGRRLPLMGSVLFFSVVELLCGVAPNFTVFLVLRGLYGIGMGGEWGVGASLAMEAAPKRWRGIFSGIVQSGYPVGYLLAAVAARLILPAFSPDWGWRAMFWVGAGPALLSFFILARVPESKAWQVSRQSSVGEILRTLKGHAKPFAYLVLLMTLMMFLSHGTQDLYPDFLKTDRALPSALVSYVAILYNLGAITGSITFGHLSESFGRRRGMIAALTLSLVVIPAWAFGRSALVLALGAFVMQIGVQGAWGIIPAHLNEVSPGSTRSLLPGLAYQLGILFAAPTNSIEYGLRNLVGYGRAMALFEATVLVVGATVIGFGWEHRGRDFMEVAGSGAKAHGSPEGWRS